MLASIQLHFLLWHQDIWLRQIIPTAYKICSPPYNFKDYAYLSIRFIADRCAVLYRVNISASSEVCVAAQQLLQEICWLSTSETGLTFDRQTAVLVNEMWHLIRSNKLTLPSTSDSENDSAHYRNHGKHIFAANFNFLRTYICSDLAQWQRTALDQQTILHIGPSQH